MRWYQAISTRVWEVADVTSTGIDEKNNIITIGVSNLDQHQPAVRAIAEARGVPTAALEVVEREAVKPLLEKRDDRRTRVSHTSEAVLDNRKWRMSMASINTPAMRATLLGWHTSTVRTMSADSTQATPFRCAHDVSSALASALAVYELACVLSRYRLADPAR